MNDLDFGRTVAMLAQEAIAVRPPISRRACLAEGETLCDELIDAPQVITCLITA